VKSGVIVRLSRLIVRAASLLAPRAARESFVREWWAELSTAGCAGGTGGRGSSLRLVLRTLGAVPHALALHEVDLRIGAIHRDGAYALRVLLRSPVYLIAATLTVALGVGVSTAAFGLVNAVLLRPLPVEDQDRLVILQGEDAVVAGAVRRLPEALREVLEARQRSFSGLARVHGAGTTPFSARYDGRQFPLTSTFVGGRFFEVLGVRALHGRLVIPSDDALSAEEVIVLNERAWRREFGADPAVVGRRIEVQGRARTIIGVAAAGFEYPRGSESWMPLGPFFGVFGAPPPEVAYLDLVARVRPGVSVAEAASEYAGIVERYYADTPMGVRRTGTTRPFAEAIVGDVKPGLVLLSVAVCLILLLSSLNVASLVLTRGHARAAELAVRASLGATRTRLMAMLIAEHAVIALSGGIAGVLVAAFLLRGVRLLAGPSLVRFDDASFDLPVLVAACCALALALLIFGIVPAVRAVGQTGMAVRARRLHATTKSAIRFRVVIASAQVALSLIVLSGAGLLIRSQAQIQSIDLGFEPRGLLLVGLQMGDVGPMRDPDERAQRMNRFSTMIESLEGRLPGRAGIVAATGVTTLPFSGGTMETAIALAGQDAAAAQGNPAARFQSVSETLFGTLNMTILRGRGFTRQDDGSSAPVAVVNESFARWAWPGLAAVGRRVRLGQDADGEWRDVVGVVRDTRYASVLDAPRPAVYIPVRQDASGPGVYLAIRTEGDPLDALPAVRTLLAELEPGAGIRRIETGDALLAGPLAPGRFVAAILTSLSVAALVLAITGLAGLLAFVLGQRANEFGVRIAIGAAPREIRRLMVGQALQVTIPGMAAGIVITLAGSRLLRALLFQVDPMDTIALASAAVTLSLAAAVVTISAGRTANAIDPMRTLRM
jgi:predicted permease